MYEQTFEESFSKDRFYCALLVLMFYNIGYLIDRIMIFSYICTPTKTRTI